MNQLTTLPFAAWATSLGLSLFAVGVALAAGTGPARISPRINIFRGERCVDDTEFMRRNHMDVLRHQSNATLHRGIRTTKYSLKNCVSCHADPKTNSVLGKDGFCESCHAYASISLDCFSCHSSSPETASLPAKTATPRRRGAIQAGRETGE